MECEFLFELHGSFSRLCSADDAVELPVEIRRITGPEHTPCGLTIEFTVQ
jgi:hypothetical protein